jgi:hypothetical protein
MTYDLEMITDICAELGLRTVVGPPDRVRVELESGVVLVFINAERDEDSRVGFEDVGWHYHEELLCSDRYGSDVELEYLNVLTGLADGTVLLCEHWRQGALKERSLVHRDFVDEFRFLREGDEVRVWRPARETR